MEHTDALFHVPGGPEIEEKEQERYDRYAPLTSALRAQGLNERPSERELG